MKLQNAKVLFYILIIIGLTMSSCASKQPEPEYQSAKVISETGLYDDLGIDAEQIATLTVGTELKPSDNASYFLCESFTDSGMNFRLCKVEVIGKGLVGWVLEKYIQKN